MNLQTRIKKLEKIINTNKTDSFFIRNINEGGLLKALAPDDMDWEAFKERHEDTSGIGLINALLDELREEEQKQ